MTKKSSTANSPDGSRKPPPKGPKQQITIAAPNFQTAIFQVRGTSQLVGNKFSARARADMKAKMEAGSTANKGAKRKPKDFKKLYREAIHFAVEGWEGIPAPAFRNAMISACRMVGYQMTRAKLCVFVEADGYDSDDDTPLVRIRKGKSKYGEHLVRNDTGVADLRPRPVWAPGWEATVRVKFDADQFTLEDVANLLSRAGVQCGILAGRPNSQQSNGMGWGCFEIVNQRSEK